MSAKKSPSLYRLKSLMNVRAEPNLTASILNAKPAGTLVAVESIVDGWLKLTDGGYILYEAGKYAEKM